jgi:hypothetical protein
MSRRSSHGGSGTAREAARPVAGPESDSTPRTDDSALPQRSRDEEAIGWGDERGLNDDADADVARLLADRPPHHDRD